MISFIDQMSRLKANLLDAIPRTDEIINKLYSNEDDVIKQILYPKPPYEIVNLAESSVSAVTDLINTLDGVAVTMADGSIDVLDKIENDSSIAISNRAGDALVRISWNVDATGKKHYTMETTAKEDLAPDCPSMDEIVNQLVETTQINEVVLKAIDLATAGQLTASNLTSSVGYAISTGSSAVSDVIDLISATVQSNNAFTQAQQLYGALKQMYGGWIGATASDEAHITFNNAQYRVDISLAFAVLSTVASTATALISFCLAIINPVVGAIAGTLSYVVSSAVSAVSDNSNTEPLFVAEDQRDNSCFAMPFIQKSISSNRVPKPIRDAVDNHGMAKFQNGLFTLYSWREDNGLYSVECYVSALFNYSMEWTSELLVDHVYSCMDSDRGRTWPISVEKNNVQHLLENINEYGNQVPFDRDRVGTSPSATSVIRLVNTTAILAYLSMCGYYGSALQKKTNETMWYTGSAPASLDDAVINIQKFLLWINMNARDPVKVWFDEGSYTYHDSGPLDGATAYAGIVNCILPSISYLVGSQSGAADADSYWFFNAVSYGGLRSSPSSPNDRGGYGFISYPSVTITNKANCYVYPPTSSVSNATRLFIAGLACATIMAGIAISAVRVKGFIRRKAFSKRAELTKKFALAQETGRVEDYNAAYKATSSYNRVWGRLSGTSYDINNGWTNQLTSSGSAAVSVTEVLKGTVASGSDLDTLIGDVRALRYVIQ